MRRLPRISSEDMVAWINTTGNDVRSWTLKPGAPERIVDAFPELVEAMLEPDSLPAETPKFDGAMPDTVDMANPSTLFVRIWQLARDARNQYDEAVAIGLDKPLDARLEAHAKELELLRDQIHNALLTDEDKANGASPRSERSN